MKSKSIILITIIVITLAYCNVYANASYILPYEKTTYMNINTKGNSGWEVTSSQSFGNVAITKEGTLIMSPNTSSDTLMIKNSDAEYEQKFLNPVIFNFEEDGISDTIYFDQPVIVSEGKNKYIAASDSNKAILNFNNTEIGSGILSLEFDAYKPDVNTADLFSIESIDGAILGQISLQRRSTSTVYFAYKGETGIIPLRSNIIEIKQWVHINAQFDFNNKTITVYANRTKMIDNIPFLGSNGELSIGKLKFGVNIDNVELYSGTKCITSDLRLNVPSEIVAGKGIRNAVKCDAEVKLNDTWYTIDGKYLNFSLSGSDAVKFDDGYLVINGDQLTNDVIINIKAGIVISQQIIETESIVTVKKNGDMSGIEYGKFIADKAIVSQNGNDTVIKVSAYNPEKENKKCYVLLGFYNGNQCSDIVLWHWEIPMNSYNVTKEFVLGNSVSSSTRVFILDAESLADIQ